MATKISDSEMTSDVTRHAAHTEDPLAGRVARAAGPVGTDAESFAEALDGSERKLLLSRLARTEPAVVEAGIAWLAEYHMAARERRRVANNRNSQERRRRQRALAMLPSEN